MSAAKKRPVPVQPPAGLKLLRVEHAAWELSCSIDLVYDLIRKGKLAVRRVESNTRIHVEDLEAYVRSVRAQARPGDEAPVAASPARVSLREAGLIGEADAFKPWKGRGAG
jgi:excisionase family DNA binding protein